MYGANVKTIFDRETIRQFLSIRGEKRKQRKYLSTSPTIMDACRNWKNRNLPWLTRYLVESR